MDYSLSHHNTLPLQSPPPAVKKSKFTLKFNYPPNFTPGILTAARFTAKPGGGNSGFRSSYRKPLAVVARAGGPSHCEFSSLNSPLEPTTSSGRFLSKVLQNQPHFFDLAVEKELKDLANDRDAAVARMELCAGTDEACLHRRIAQLKEHECQMAIEDVMYMSVFYKFSEIKVPLVPKLARCIYNGRLEILPSKDWDLESIHSFEVLEMIREHVSTVTGLRANAGVTDSWATTKIQRLHLGRIYAASILYGYFLKSASLRHHLERSLALAHQDLCSSHRTSLKFPEKLLYGLKNIIFGRVSNLQSLPLGQGSSTQENKHENLKFYVMSFDSQTLQRCAKLKSKEAVNLIEKHSCALFADAKTGLLGTDEVILTSFSSLKRLVLEAVAFGSFLWDTEEYVDTVYKLKEN